MKADPKQTEIEYVQIEGEYYFKIPDSDTLRPFFMSIVSASNHWMFISSNGGLTAGRKNANHALFPYYSDDKISESAEITGSKSIFRIEKEGTTHLWEPFSQRFEGRHQCTRNLYKSRYGNKIVFEEVNHDLGLRYSYQWSSSNAFGFVRTSRLSNEGEASVTISLLDGIQNILPFGVGSELQNRQSNLVDAYKRNELLEKTGVGIYALSAIIVDKAEPSEALKANIAWSLGLEDPTYLLSSLQLPDFRDGKTPRQETDVKAEKGAYFLHAKCELAAAASKKWTVVTNVNQDHAAIAELSKALKDDPEALAERLQRDVRAGTEHLVKLCATSDGLQNSSDRLRDTRHFSNTLFNVMRGGIFDDGYRIEKGDFRSYLQQANKEVYQKAKGSLDSLPEVFSLQQLKDLAGASGDPDFQRLALEYLPLKFSRRHGDPSRPWNVFSINTHSEVDGSKILDYQGNWRDIFQNWEALAHSYPEFIEGMISKFLNASTFDGYNPYRVTKDGFDWEIIEPEDPWSYIGYWGDHQIIYLLKFLEFAESHNPGALGRFFDRDLFAYANVPYRIKPYGDLLKNPKDTIDFNTELDQRIRKEREAIGADGALLKNQAGAIHRVNFLEKILATALAKLSNFIPEGGIWMNTQRPEWNDANNALVGNGVSMVTLYYLRRFMAFMKTLLHDSSHEEVSVSSELHTFFQGVLTTLETNRGILQGALDDRHRKQVLDGLGQSGSAYRETIYEKNFTGEKKIISLTELEALAEVSLEYLEHSIRANRRADHMYHAYNLMEVMSDDRVSISYLDEMLEGQVAVLSSGLLTAGESLQLLDGLKGSALFREDQYSYLLYPAKELPKFQEKNRIPKEQVAQSALLTEFVERGHRHIIVKDVEGVYHFNGNFRNAGDLQKALEDLPADTYTHLNEKEKTKILQIFEAIFNHKAFTGRSGTFFGYEGLGSIYWHMVSKLQLAVQETCLRAIQEGAEAKVFGRLLEHYYEIEEGIGVHKSPELYGAFPTDPYSHTPQWKGAQQPGMTGQVKEDILSRFGELGVFVKNGCLVFDPCLLRREEFHTGTGAVRYIDVHGETREHTLPAGSLFFTYCQVPVVYNLSDQKGVEVLLSEGNTLKSDSPVLDRKHSEKVFKRTGEVVRIEVHLKKAELR